MRYILIPALFFVGCASAPVLHNFNGAIVCEPLTDAAAHDVLLRVIARDDKGQSLPGVTVTPIFQGGGHEAAAAVTGAEGLATFQLHPGTYRVTTDLFPFESQQVFLYLGTNAVCTIEFIVAVDMTKMVTIT